MAQVNRVIAQGENLDDTGRPESGLPFGLSMGVVGLVGGPGEGVLVVVDPAVVRPQAMRSRLMAEVNDIDIEVVESCNSSSDLAVAWRASVIDPADIVEGTGVGRYFDPQTEQIVVEGRVSAATTEKHTAAGYRDFVRYDDSLISSRTSRTDGTAPWKGGLRIRRQSSTQRCSAGFSVIRNGTSTRAMVTAGHCSGNNVRWNNGATGVLVVRVGSS